MVVATRGTALPLVTAAVCVLVTTSVRGHVAEVLLDEEDGLDHESAANCDSIFTLPKTVLVRRRGRLSPPKRAQFDRALSIALGLA